MDHWESAQKPQGSEKKPQTMLLKGHRNGSARKDCVLCKTKTQHMLC